MAHEFGVHVLVVQLAVPSGDDGTERDRKRDALEMNESNEVQRPVLHVDDAQSRLVDDPTRCTELALAAAVDRTALDVDEPSLRESAVQVLAVAEL